MNSTYAPYRLSDTASTTSDGDYRLTLRVRDMEESDRPRAKLQAVGPSNLSTSELLAIVWGSGNKKEDVIGMATRTIKDYGEKAIITETDPTRLAETVSISEIKASQLIASLELGRRQYTTQNGRPVYIRNAKHAYAYLKEIGFSQKEQLRGLYLNSRYQIIHDEIISIGTLTSNLVHPREVFKPALDRSAAALIIAHNHPSGILEPTDADVMVTEQLAAAGKILGIELLDHIIVTPSKYLSLLASD